VLASHGTPFPFRVSPAKIPKMYASAGMIGASSPPLDFHDRAPLFPRPRDFFALPSPGNSVDFTSRSADPLAEQGSDSSGWLRGLLRNVRGKAGAGGGAGCYPGCTSGGTDSTDKPVPSCRLRRRPASYTRTEAAIECRSPQVSPSGIRPRNSQLPFPATCDPTHVYAVKIVRAART